MADENEEKKEFSHRGRIYTANKNVCPHCGRVGLLIFEFYYPDLIEFRYLCPRCYHLEVISKKKIKQDIKKLKKIKRR